MTQTISKTVPATKPSDDSKKPGQDAQKNGQQAERDFTALLSQHSLWDAGQLLQEWREFNEVPKRGMMAQDWKIFGEYLRENGLIGPSGSFISQPYVKSSQAGQRSVKPDVMVFRTEGSDLAIEVKNQKTGGSVNQKVYELTMSMPQKLAEFEFHVVYTGEVKTFGRLLVDAMVEVLNFRSIIPGFQDNFGGFQNHDTMLQIIKSPLRNRAFELKHFYNVAEQVNSWDVV